MNKFQFNTTIRILPTDILEQIYDFAFLNTLQRDGLFKELVLHSIQGKKWAQKLDYFLENEEDFVNYAMISYKKKILTQRHHAIAFGHKYIIYMPNVKKPYVIKRCMIEYE